jgi:hypothetical protein
MNSLTAAAINEMATKINNLPASKRANIIKWLVANRPPRVEGRFATIRNLEGCVSSRGLTHKVGTGGCTQ